MFQKTVIFLTTHQFDALRADNSNIMHQGVTNQLIVIKCGRLP